MTGSIDFQLKRSKMQLTFYVIHQENLSRIHLLHFLVCENSQLYHH